MTKIILQPLPEFLIIAKYNTQECPLILTPYKCLHSLQPPPHPQKRRTPKPLNSGTQMFEHPKKFVISDDFYLDLRP